MDWAEMTCGTTGARCPGRAASSVQSARWCNVRASCGRTIVKLAQPLCPPRFAMKRGHERLLDDAERIARARQGGRDGFQGVAQGAT
jgi:hypothetical protein